MIVNTNPLELANFAFLSKEFCNIFIRSNVKTGHQIKPFLYKFVVLLGRNEVTLVR
jgi:hypothetical protein